MKLRHFLGWAGTSLGMACGAITPLPVAQLASPQAKPSPPAAAPRLPWVESEPASQSSGQSVALETPLVLRGESPLVALVGATVMTATGAEIANGVVVLRDGRILAVGPRASTAVPADAQVIELPGQFITPGLIDTHSHMGVYAVPYVRAHSDGNEMTSPVTAHVRAADSFWPQDPSLSHALRAGVTTIQVLPGSANLIGGQGVTIKLLPGRSVDDMRLLGAPKTLKMACGENPKRVYGGRHQAPSTRMGSVAGYRKAFQKAREYQAKFIRWQKSHEQWLAKSAKTKGSEATSQAPAMPSRDFGLETLVGALEGRVLVQMHCYRADEMLGMLRLASQIGLKIRAFHHAIEAFKIRDVLAAQGVGVSTWADWWGFKMEAFDEIPESLALLSADGVRVALHSDSPSLIQLLNQEAAKAMTAATRAGLTVTRDTALRWITTNAAWTLGIEEVTGTLEVGKMADVVVWNGDPFSVYSKPERVYVDGQLAFEHTKRPRRPSDFELGLKQQIRPLKQSTVGAGSVQ